MCCLVVHPTLTILFDLFLIGSATVVVATMLKEYLDSRLPAVGSHGSPAIGMARSVAFAPAAHRQTVAGRRPQSLSLSTRSHGARKRSVRRAVTGSRSMPQVIWRLSRMS